MIGWIAAEAVWALLMLMLLAVISSESTVLMLRRSSTEPVTPDDQTTNPNREGTMILTTRQRLIAVFATIGLAFALLLTVSASTPAKANSPALTKVYNDTSGTIGVRFHTNWGTWVDLNIGAHSWQGEVQGNTAYEPRSIHLGAGWCINYYYKVAGRAAGSTSTACGGSAGGWQNIYLGDGYTTNYDVHVSAVFPG